MKTKLFILLAAACSASAATININSVSPGASGGSAFFDNAGNPLSGGSLYVFAGTSPSDFETASGLIGSEIVSFSLDNLSPGGGLISGGVSFDNTSGEFTDADLFVIMGNSSNTAFIAYDLETTPTAADTATNPFSAFEQLGTVGAVTLGTVTEGATIDYSALGQGTPSGTGFTVQAIAIPEPSSALLAGLAFVGGLVRRRR